MFAKPIFRRLTERSYLLSRVVQRVCSKSARELRPTSRGLTPMRRGQSEANFPLNRSIVLRARCSPPASWDRSLLGLSPNDRLAHTYDLVGNLLTPRKNSKHGVCYDSGEGPHDSRDSCEGLFLRRGLLFGGKAGVHNGSLLSVVVSGPRPSVRDVTKQGDCGAPRQRGEEEFGVVLSHC